MKCRGTIEAFRDGPERFWTFYLELARLCGGAKPNPAHEALAKLEAMGLIDGIITQNVDGLHQAAGSKNVIELHGGADALICIECRARRPEKIAALAGPPRCECGAIMKPDVVLFNEMLPFGAIEKAQDLARKCDVCLVVGTSAVVYPAASIPDIAFEHGATVCEFTSSRRASRTRAACGTSSKAPRGAPCRAWRSSWRRRRSSRRVRAQPSSRRYT